MKAERQKGLWDWQGVRETDDVVKKQKESKSDFATKKRWRNEFCLQPVFITGRVRASKCVSSDRLLSALATSDQYIINQ